VKISQKILFFPAFFINIINIYTCKEPEIKITYQIFSKTVWHPLKRKILFIGEIKNSKKLPTNRIKVYYINKKNKDKYIDKIVYFQNNYVQREDLYIYNNNKLLEIESYKNQEIFQRVRFKYFDSGKGYQENIFKYKKNKVKDKYTILVHQNSKKKNSEMFFYQDGKFKKKIEYSYLKNGKLESELVYENGKIYKRTREAVFKKIPSEEIGDF